MDDTLRAYLALREANDRRRESGMAMLRQSLLTCCEELTESASILTGREDWQFETGGSTMIGERLGFRYGMQTLIIEAGWPRLPEHGYVPGLGLARGRVGISPNVMIRPIPIVELVLRRGPEEETVWHLADGGLLTPDHLREWFRQLITL